MKLLYFRQKGDNASGEYVVLTEGPKSEWQEHAKPGYFLHSSFDVDGQSVSSLPTEEPLTKEI
jgi:hypothetical protein